MTQKLNIVVSPQCCSSFADLKSTLCACFRNGAVYFMESCDDADPTIVHTELNGEFVFVCVLRD